MIGKTHIISGANGVVGSRLVEHLAKHGERVVAIVRQPKDRLTRLLSRRLCQDSLKCVSIVEGDLSHPTLALEDDAIKGLLGSSRVFWHCAADVRFDERHRDSIFRANIEGTGNALRCASRLKAELFCHMSTAFVCGDHGGVFPESPCAEIGQKFNNPYEESKHSAERLVADNPIPWLIFRLPVVVGDSTDGYVSGFSGYYGFWALIWRLRMELNPRLDEVVHIPIRIPSAKDSVFHMATSDAVVRAMCIASLGQKRASKVFNLVPQHSKTCEWHIMEGMKHLRISGVQMRWRTELETREGRIQLLERRVARGIRPYLAYISTGVRFENSSVNEVIGADWHDEITEALPQTLLAFAIKKDFSTTFPSVSAGNFIPKT